MPTAKKFKKKSQLNASDISALCTVYGISRSHCHNILNGNRPDKLGLFYGAEQRIKIKKKNQNVVAMIAAKHQ